MAKKKKSRRAAASPKQRAQRAKFKNASKVCFATASTGKAFGSCMKSEMKGRSKKRR